MQTFRAGGSDDPQPSKKDYKPFIPEEATVESQNVMPDQQQHVPVAQTTVPPQESISGQPVAPQPQQMGYQQAPMGQGTMPAMDGRTDTYYYQPEHVYYPPTQQQYQAHHGGMDRQKFRSLIIGFLLLALAAFIFIIVLFGKRGSQDYFAQTQNIADITIFQPVFEQRVSPTFQVVGEARGYWFDDNESFPVTVYDNRDNPVAFAQAIAQGEIDGDAYTPFQAIIDRYDFLPSKKKGYVALQRPGTTPEMGGLFTIPIEFIKKKGNFVTSVGSVDTGNSSTGGSATSGSSSSGSSSGTSGGSSTGGSGSGSTLNPNSCANGIDDDGDNFIDINDPECHTDFDPFNFSSYAPANVENDASNTQNTVGAAGSGGQSGGSSVGGFVGTHPGNVILYFPNINDNPLNPSCTKLFQVNRSLGSDATGDVVRATLQQLITGPNTSELAQGFALGAKKGLTIDAMQLSQSGALSIYFDQSNIVADQNLCDVDEVVTQITKTMQQFADVNTVRIYANGSLQ